MANDDKAKKDGAETPELSAPPEKTETVKTPATESVPTAPADKGQSYTGKNSILKWIIIYLVIGAVIYGAWYYFSVAQNSGASTDSTTSGLYQ